MTTAQGWFVSRTGYTGERVAYELFVHPDEAAAVFQRLIDLGAAPCGLAARDSLRIEAGLPLYGHELAGELGLNPAEAGFGSFVKLYKPFFVGKRAFTEREMGRTRQVKRFRLDNKGGRPAQEGDAIVDARGRIVGQVNQRSQRRVWISSGAGAAVSQSCPRRDAVVSLRRQGEPRQTHAHAAALDCVGRVQEMSARIMFCRSGGRLSRTPLQRKSI